MIGTKFYKGKYDDAEYAECANWCNENNATIEDKGDYYECVEIPVHVPTAEEIQQQLTAAVQRHMDTTVQTRGYDNILSACSYVNTGIERFDIEGSACRDWRSTVWDKCYAILAEVKAGTREIPTEEELISELPKLEW